MARNLIRFLPESVLVGFTAGAGLLIAAMQLDEALGLGGVRASGLVSELRAVGSSLPGLGVPALLVAGATVAVGLSAGRRSARFPAALIAVLGGRGLRDGRRAWRGERPAPRARPGRRPERLAGAGRFPASTRASSSSCSIPASAIVLLGSLELAVTARAGGARPDT